jgi:SSS family transporter
MLILFIIVLYFSSLLFISFVTGKNNSNDSYFLGDRKSPWYIIAFGMIGSSISGVTFVSVPGWVRTTNFGYMQMVFGFFFGYLIIAKVLLPLYYKLNIVTIYTYLKERFGICSYKTGASFFILSRSIASAARLYIVAIILKTFIFDKILNINLPFIVIVIAIMLIIWLYTFRSGIKTVIWTDSLQTFFLIAALCLIIYQVSKNLNFHHVSDVANAVMNSKYSPIFEFNDWHSRQYFFKQFISGIFITIVMTGLDQDMMQKNLSCKTLKEAQRNMYFYGLMFIPLNFLFLSLGALILMFSQQQHINLPLLSDEILPTIIANGYFGTITICLFAIGLISAAFSSVDSAITALSTSFYIDILGNEVKDNSVKKHKLRTTVHIGFCVLFIFLILLFRCFNNKSAIDTIYTIVSYTYGPLLGLFSFGLFTKRMPKDKYVPYITVMSPILVSLLDFISKNYFNYQFGYELLMINGLITFIGLLLISKKKLIPQI